MSSIIREGDTFHGISVDGRGVFTNDNEFGRHTYAGQIRDGHACGLGVATWPDGTKGYAEHGPDGKYDGRYLDRWADGHTYYCLVERGEAKENAHVSADGRCTYNGEDCAPDDPRLLALIAQVAPVEVRPAARAPTRHSPPSIVRWIGRLALLPQALATAVATEVRLHAARRRWWLHDTARQQPHCTARPRSDACTGFFSRYWSHGRRVPSCTLTTPGAHLWARPGSAVAKP